MEVPYLLQPPLSDEELELAYEFLLEQRPADEAANLRRAFRGRDLPTINRLLALYGAERKPVERSSSGKASYRLGQQVSTSKAPDPADLRKIEFAVTEGLRKSLGPRWFETDVDRENLISEAMKIWLERYGWFQAPTPDMVKEVVKRVRSASPELRKVFESPEFEKFEPSSPGGQPASQYEVLAEKREREQRVDSTSLLDVFHQYLETLAQGSPTDQFKRVVIMLHLGNRVIPGQPSALSGGIAFSNFMKFHGANVQARPCPACKVVARYLRAPGLTPDQVAVITNNFFADLSRSVRG